MTRVLYYFILRKKKAQGKKKSEVKKIVIEASYGFERDMGGADGY